MTMGNPSNIPVTKIKTLMILIFLMSCESKGINDETLSSQINNLVSQSNSNSLALEKMTDFGWDRVYIFGPYTPADSINSLLGFKWELSDKLNIQDDDLNCLVIFTKGNAVVKYFLHPRNQGDFAVIKKHSFNKADAIFDIEKRNIGKQTWVYFRDKS